jgi:hypothetical protein
MVAGVQSGRSNADWFIVRYPRFLHPAEYRMLKIDVVTATRAFKAISGKIGQRLEQA